MTQRARKLRIVPWTVGGLLAAALICLLAIAGIINSETASRHLLRYTADALDIVSGPISGTLASGVKIEGLRYYSGAADIRIGRLSFDWEPLALLYGTGKFRTLRLDDVQIECTPAPAPDEKKLPDFSSPLRVSIMQGEVHNLRLQYGEREFELGQIRLDAVLGSNLTLNELILEAPVYRVSAEGSINSSFPHAGEIELEWQYATGPGFAGTAHLSGDLEQLKLEHNLTAPWLVATTGHINPGLAEDAPPHVELRTHWSELRLQQPLVPVPLSAGGWLQVTGWLDGYHLLGQGNLESPTLPSLQFSLDARGDRMGLDTAVLELDGLEGKMRTEGSLRWLPAFEWRADIAAAGLDLRQFHPELPRDLQLDFQAHGGLAAGQWRVRLDDIRGAGSVRDYPLRLEGELAFENGSLSSPGLSLEVAKNSLTLSGSVIRRLDLQWQLKAPDLSALWPELAGTLVSGGSITGNPKSPKLAATITGEDLVYGDYRMAILNAELQTQSPRQQVLTLVAERIMVDGKTVAMFTVNARGGIAGHRIESRILGDSLTADIVIEGNYGNAQWRGRLQRAELNPANLPAWALQQSVAMTLTSGSMRIGPACWSAADARICLQFDRIGNGVIDGEASLVAVPAGLFQPWLGPRLAVTGLVGGSFQVNGSIRNPTGRLELTAPAGEIEVRRAGMPVDGYSWENAVLQADLRDKQLTATAGLVFPEHGNAQADLSVNLSSRALEGSIAAVFDNLAPLETAFPELADLRGHLEARLDLGGMFNSPRLSGSLLLSGVSARVPRLGIIVQNLQLSAANKPGDDIAFKGQADSGDGRLLLQGSLAYSGNTPVLKASIEGEDFEILRLPQLQAHISPSLDISARPKHADIRGTVRIPSAQIDIRTPPEFAVTVSEDVIIVNAPSRLQQGDDFRLTGNVRMILGEDIRFQGFGLSAGLAGQLTLRQSPDRPVETIGELTVKHGGQYKIYGQQLEIERGRLLFQGPHDNPGLDIIAVRRTPDVTVNLEIGGTLENPGSRVAADPPLPDSEAMAILITGKPLGSASETDANALVNAITGLGLRKAKFITDEIAQTFNLDEFNIKTESDVSASSLLIGKRISPRLFIRYIVGLFDQTSRIGLSYQLSRQLRLEAESGWNQSMDLIYEIER
jgi:translocation and assembly module TamB